MKHIIKLLFLVAVKSAFSQAITDTGTNVGIGAASPIEKLHINEGNIRVFGYNTSRYLRFTEANLQGGFINYDGTSNVLNIGVNNINSTDVNNDVKAISIVRSTGNIGVGTVTPNSKLEISYGSGSSSVPGVKIFGGGAVYENIALSLEDTGTASNNINILEFKNSSLRSAIIKSVNPAANTSTGGNLIFETTSNYIGTLNENQLFLKNNGDIGVGTNAPDSKLTVAGNIHAQEVKVTVNAGADFVFNENYRLPKLEEVEKFIKENKHLPEIASEKEMQDNGLLLAEMNIKLLQKIEELTLYTIGQQKLIEEQSKKLESQAKILKDIQGKLKN